MYEFGTLRPPTPVEMEKRRVPLEHIEVTWRKPCHPEAAHMRDDYCKGGGEARCVGVDTVFVTALAEFIKGNAIPVGAVLRSSDPEGELELDWTHLRLCEVCKLWALPHGEEDEYHKLMLRVREQEAAR